MPRFHSLSSSPSASASESAASGAVGSQSEDSPVTDIILYSFQDFVLTRYVFSADSSKYAKVI